MEENDGFRLHQGFVVWRDPETETICVRYEGGIEKIGKRIKEVLPTHQANIDEYAEHLAGSNYETEASIDEDKLPYLHVINYTGEPIVEETPKLPAFARASAKTPEERATYQREYHKAYNARKKAEAAAMRTAGGGAVNAPVTPGTIVGPGREGNSVIEEGANYILVAGHVSVKGKEVTVVAINDERASAMVMRADGKGVPFGCRLTSLMSISEYNRLFEMAKAKAAAANPRPAVQVNTPTGSKLLSPEALERLRAKAAQAAAEGEDPESVADHLQVDDDEVEDLTGEDDDEDERDDWPDDGGSDDDEA
jgi:hypothetical protein